MPQQNVLETKQRYDQPSAINKTQNQLSGSLADAPHEWKPKWTATLYLYLALYLCLAAASGGGILASCLGCIKTNHRRQSNPVQNEYIAASH